MGPRRHGPAAAGWTARYQRLRRGRLFACYVLAYTAGRAWIEALRIDHANHFLGLRLNDWVSAVLFTGALVYLHAHSAPRRPSADDDAPRPAWTTGGERTTPVSVATGSLRTGAAS